MNKQEFVAAIAKKHALSLAEANRICDQVFGELTDQLEQGEEIKIRNFGTFCVRVHQTKSFQDFSTGQKKTLPAHPRPVFLASDHLKDRVKKGAKDHAGDHPGNL